MHDGVLFTISDKNDDTIYRIELTDDTASAVPHLTFIPPTLPSGRRLDFEGLTCDASGNFLLVSEAGFRVLFVNAKGDSVAWLTPSVKSAGEAQGLFQTPNGYLEGIAMADSSTLVLAAEREPRGLVEIDMSGDPAVFSAFTYDETRLPVQEGRNIDFAGLHFENGTSWALNRNADCISRIEYGGAQLVEREFWSFAETIRDSEFSYSDMDFGMAEGIYMDAGRIFVVLDNNRIARKNNPDDRRPLFLILARP